MELLLLLHMLLLPLALNFMIQGPKGYPPLGALVLPFLLWGFPEWVNRSTAKLYNFMTSLPASEWLNQVIKPGDHESEGVSKATDAAAAWLLTTSVSTPLGDF